jgi:phage terminase Nu1 subunit (DNA packaging protein)
MDKKQAVVIERLRGHSLDACAATASCSKAYASQTVNAEIRRLERGDIAGNDEDHVKAYRRYRAEKTQAEAQLRRLDCREREGELISLDSINEQFSLIARHLRNAQKQLDKDFGVEAGNIVRDALRAATREHERIGKPKEALSGR